MKKFITKTLALILTLVLSVGFFSGCDLITTDVEADMNQTIATIGLEGMNKEDVKKGQLVAAFNNSGYLYMYYYGYSEAQTYQKLLEDLIKNRIVVQQAKQAFATGTDVLGNAKGFYQLAKEAENKTTIEESFVFLNHDDEDMANIDKNASVDKFLTKYEYNQAMYEALKGIDSLIESVKETEEEEHHHNHGHTSVTPRATLTIESEVIGNEYEIKNDEKLSVITEEYKKSFKKDVEALNLDLSNATTKYEYSLKVYEEYINKFFSRGANEDEQKNFKKETKKALNKVIKNLKKSGLITSEEASKKTPETVEELFAISYFKAVLDSEFEGILVNKLNLALENNEKNKIKADDSGNLYAEYVDLYESQKASFTSSYEAYETALENVSNTSFVVYNPDYKQNQNDKKVYGYISNLLIGFNAEQSAALSSFSKDKEKEQDRIDYRNSLLKDLRAKDLRHTWVLSNYGTYENGVFSFGENYVKTEALREYKGVLTGPSTFIEHDSYDEEITKYSFKSVEGTEIAFDTFYKDTVAEVMGFNKGSFEGVLDNLNNNTTNISTTIDEEALAKFTDLIYAYSTDSGSLKESYGYVYSPMTSKTTYVKEFADAAERLVNKGVGSYEVVATDYGYHIMLCTAVLNAGNACLNETEFKEQLNIEGSLAYNFKEYKYDLISSTIIARITNTVVNKFKDNTDYVTYYESRYSELVTEEE